MKVLFFLLSVLVPVWSSASVCCGTSSTGVSTIVTDRQWSMDATYGIGDVSTIVDQNGYWRRTREVSLQLIDLAATGKINEVLFLRAMTGLQQRQISGNATATLMTDLTIDAIRPLNLANALFFRTVLPTGRSSFDGNYTLAEISGRGYLQVGLGAQIRQRLSSFAILSELEIHQGVNRKISGVVIDPGFGSGISTLIRWDRWKVEPFVSARFIYESPIEIKDQFPHSTSLERSVITSLGVYWRPTAQYEVGLGYSTQRWLGTPINSALVNIVTVQLSVLEFSFDGEVQK